VAERPVALPPAFAERAMPDHLLSLDDMRERLDRAHSEAEEIIK
jgi:hypothetical protein